MKLADIRTYCLTTLPRTDRHLHMAKRLRGLRMTPVYGPTTHEGKARPRLCGALGYSDAIGIGLDSGGVPFIVIEDDAALMPGASLELDVPADADGVYLGVSTCSVHPTENTHEHDLIAEDVPGRPDLVRVHNMLSTHAILYTSLRFAIAAHNKAREAARLCAMGQDVGWDCPIARLQPAGRVYALRRPLFYQAAVVGGNEAETRCTFGPYRLPA